MCCWWYCFHLSPGQMVSSSIFFFSLLKNPVLEHHKDRNIKWFQARKFSASSLLLIQFKNFMEVSTSSIVSLLTLSMSLWWLMLHQCRMDLQRWHNLNMDGCTSAEHKVQLLEQIKASLNKLWPRHCQLNSVKIRKSREKRNNSFNFFICDVKKVTRWKKGNIFELWSRWFEKWMQKGPWI